MSIDVFTDGACINNGKSNASAGYGVYFPNEEFKNISKSFNIEPITNQRSELFAIYIGLKTIITSGEYNYINVYTDSEYSMKSLTIWKNSKNAKGQKRKNLDIIEPILKLINNNENITIKFIHVRSHTNKQTYEAIGNEYADKLATKAVKRLPSLFIDI